MYKRYVIGDIHGCVKTLEKLLFGVLKADSRDLIFLLGDYIDRGPSSRAVIDLIFSLQAQNYNIFPVRGNHEQMLLEYYTYNNDAWLYNGFQTTLDSFSIRKIHDIGRTYLHFFDNLKHYYITDGYILTHAGLNNFADNPLTDGHSMLWTRDDSVNIVKTGGLRLVSGHTPHAIDDIENSLGNMKIQLDGGCVYAGKRSGMGRLCALDLDTLELFRQENIDIAPDYYI